jgi:hypothetical protein
VIISEARGLGIGDWILDIGYWVLVIWFWILGIRTGSPSSALRMLLVWTEYSEGAMDALMVIVSRGEIDFWIKKN